MMSNAPVLDYGKVVAPTLLLAGGADRLIPPHATFELTDHIRGARAVELHVLPHVGALEAPDRIAAAIRSFLNE